MRIDNAVNYSSFMQHYDASSLNTSSGLSLRGVSEAVAVPEKKEQGTAVLYSTEDIKTPSVTGNSPYRNTAVEDIEIEFSKEYGSETLGLEYSDSSGIRKAISDMEKDALLHEYQYFVGDSKTKTLVDDSDGVVIKLA